VPAPFGSDPLGLAIGVIVSRQFAQVSVNALAKDRGRLVQVHRAGPSQHIAQNAFMEGHVRGQLPGRIKRLAHEAGNAIQRCLHDTANRFLSCDSNARQILPIHLAMCQ
jgi:hypothetical protein